MGSTVTKVYDPSSLDTDITTFGTLNSGLLTSVSSSLRLEYSVAVLVSNTFRTEWSQGISVASRQVFEYSAGVLVGNTQEFAYNQAILAASNSIRFEWSQNNSNYNYGFIPPCRPQSVKAACRPASLIKHSCKC